MELSHLRAGRGEPLLLIHGIGSRRQMWLPVLDGLARHHEVIAIDLPGFGDSAMPPPGTSPGIDSLVELVHEFLVGLGLERVHTAGNSLGGLVVLEMARRGLVRSATALSPAGFASRTETALAHASLKVAVSSARLVAPHAELLFRSRRGRQLAMRPFVARPAEMDPGQASGDLRALAGAPWFDATLPSVGPMAYRGETAVPVPVTVAWGDRDRVLPPRQLLRAGRAIPNARLLVLAGCGHVPTYDDPELVTRVLLDGAQDGDPLTPRWPPAAPDQ